MVGGIAALLIAGTGCAALVAQSQAHATTRAQEDRRIEALASEVEALRAEGAARAAVIPTPEPKATPQPAHAAAPMVASITT